MVTYFGLYYPFIHFKDEGWLKLTALYWDGMKRIVPSGARLRDSDEVNASSTPRLSRTNRRRGGRLVSRQHFVTLLLRMGTPCVPSSESTDAPSGPRIRTPACTRLPEVTQSSPTCSRRRLVTSFSAICLRANWLPVERAILVGSGCIRGSPTST